MFDFNDKTLYMYDVNEGLFQCSYMYMQYLSICVNEWVMNTKFQKSNVFSFINRDWGDMQFICIL